MHEPDLDYDLLKELNDLMDWLAIKEGGHWSSYYEKDPQATLDKIATDIESHLLLIQDRINKLKEY